MIPFDFKYIKPETVDEAVKAYKEAEEDDLNPMYYGGGTEITTFSRKKKIKTGAVIDIKNIPGTMELKEEGNKLIFGAGLPLNRIVDSGSFPLLEKAAKGIADRTTRNKLSLGGNIAGQLPYRETALPLMISDAKVKIGGPNGIQKTDLNKVFSKMLSLEESEFLIQIEVPKKYSEKPSFYKRREKSSEVDYPVATGCFLKVNDNIRMAIGGSFLVPVREEEPEKVLNDPQIPLEEKPEKTVEEFTSNFRDDQRASSDYRKMLTKKIIKEALEKLGGN